MIIFNSETAFELNNQPQIKAWLNDVAREEGYDIAEVNYVFCDDDYLHDLNKTYLDHDTLTDVIGFDYSIGKNLQGDIFISVERVIENAAEFNTAFDQELMRVMVHGLLHFCGWTDKLDAERERMRQQEDFHLKGAPEN